MRLMSKSEFLIVPKGTKFAGSGKLGLRNDENKNHGISPTPLYHSL